jgi:hypothetical protein
LRSILAACAAAALAGCHPDCAIDAALRDFAGPGAVSCGAVEGAASTDALYACYAASLEGERAFYGFEAGAGIDSRVADGWASDGRGRFAEFRYDSCPSGCGDGDPTLFRTVCRKVAITDGHPSCDGVVGAEEEQTCP